MLQYKKENPKLPSLNQAIMKMGSTVPMSSASEFGLFHYCKVGHIRATLTWDCPQCVRMVTNLQLLIPPPFVFWGGPKLVGSSQNLDSADKFSIQILFWAHANNRALLSLTWQNPGPEKDFEKIVASWPEKDLLEQKLPFLTEQAQKEGGWKPQGPPQPSRSVGTTKMRRTLRTFY